MTFEVISREFGPLSKAVAYAVIHPKAVNDADNNMPVCVFLPGFLGREFFYKPIMHYISQHGFHVEYIQTGFSFKDFLTHADSITVFLEQKYKERPIYVIGHSLGGAFALFLALTRRLNIQSIVTIGTPFLGTPWMLLKWTVMITTGVSEHLYYKFMQEITALAAEIDIYSISSNNDLIAPQERCNVENILHIDISHFDPPVTHTTIINDSRVIEKICELLIHTSSPY